MYQVPVAGVLDEPYSQLTPLSGVAVQARQAGTVSCPSYVAWRAVVNTQFAELALLSRVRLKLQLHVLSII
jgi:hypothetical protein